MTLLDGKRRSTYRVTDMEEPLDTERRLEALGLTQGTPITILNYKRRGAVIVKVRGTRFAMGREIAAGILVEEMESEGHTNE